MDLSALRNQIKSQRLSLSKSEVISLSKQVENLLFTLDFIREKSNFFIYNSIKNEVETNGIISTLTALGKTVAFPLISGDNLISAIPKSSEFVLDRFGCKTPAYYTVMKSVDVAVIPLLACDENKNRVGYGKGYYDRFLKDKNCIKIGLAYDFQVIDSLTPNPWDVPLDIIITPTRIIGENYEGFSNRQ